MNIHMLGEALYGEGCILKMKSLTPELAKNQGKHVFLECFHP